MKKYYILLLIVISCAAKAQRPFMPIKAGTEWFVEGHCFPEFGESPCNWAINCNKIFLSDEDTIYWYYVNVITNDTTWYDHPYIYKKLYTYNPDTSLRICQYSGICRNNTCPVYISPSNCGTTPPPPGFILDYVGGLRQDTIEKKVYYKFDCPHYKDVLLYNFNLTLGDTIFYNQYYIQNVCEYFGGSGEFGIVTAIDSVLLQDGIYHWRWWVGNSMKIIEGIGTDNGPITSDAGICAPYYNMLVSAYNIITGDTLYKDPTTCSYPNHCTINLDVVGMEEVKEALIVFSIFPNPVTTEFTIKNDNKEQYYFQLFDSMGKLSVTLNSKDYLQKITTNGLASGIYYYKINRLKRPAISGKLIIE